MLNPEQQDQIRDLVEELLGLMNLKLMATVTAELDEIDINISGNDRAFLLTDDGETLLSLQYILSKMIHHKIQDTNEFRIYLDSDGFLFRHEERIRRLAYKAMERVRRERRRIRLHPMNPYDRRIVHIEVAQNEDLDSISEGEGFFKKIVVQRKSYRSDGWA